MSEIHDIKDERNIKINNVGVCDYKIPFILKNAGEQYITIATVKSGVELDSKTKGAHLSRIINVIDNRMANQELSLLDISNVCIELSKKVGVDNAKLKLCFEIILNTITPKSNNKTNMYAKIELFYECNNDKIVNSYINIKGNGAMLCPNSKSKSSYGAHSQKCDIGVKLFGEIDEINIKDIYFAVANSTSAPVYGIVRSEDEVYMTELAYDNPKFSEDAIRDVLISVRKIYKKGKISAELINYESIHQHNVFCESDIEW